MPRSWAEQLSEIAEDVLKEDGVTTSEEIEDWNEFTVKDLADRLGFYDVSMGDCEIILDRLPQIIESMQV